MFQFHKLCRFNSPLGRLTGSRSLVSKQSRDMHCRKIVLNEFGDPAKVAHLVEDTLPDQPKDKQVEYSYFDRVTFIFSVVFTQVLVKMIIAPVNPADINIIQGAYPVKPLLPSTVGAEGIGEVVAVGRSVENLVPGDRVIPDGVIGTWCTAGLFDSKLLRKVSTYLLTRLIIIFSLFHNK